MMVFDAQKYLIKVQGSDYLKPVHRVMWMRSEHPEWGIDSCVIQVGEVLYVKAELRDCNHFLIASGLATVRNASDKEKTWQGRIVEKAETAAIGRCMSHAGYGTEYAGDEMDDADYLSDTPLPPTTTPERWILNNDRCSKFVEWCTDSVGIDATKIAVALGVDNITDYAGTPDEAQALIVACAGNYDYSEVGVVLITVYKNNAAVAARIEKLVKEIIMTRLDTTNTTPFAITHNGTTICSIEQDIPM